jgi:phosphomethylpyrimidine synthase
VSPGSDSVNITENVRKYAAEQGIEAEKALEQGMREKSAEFQRGGAEVYQKA